MLTLLWRRIHKPSRCRARHNSDGGAGALRAVLTEAATGSRGCAGIGSLWPVGGKLPENKGGFRDGVECTPSGAEAGTLAAHDGTAESSALTVPRSLYSNSRTALADGVSVDRAEIASLHDAVRLRFVLNLIQNFAGLLIVFRGVGGFAGEFEIARQQVVALGEQSLQAELLAFA